jgi:hypothetical protein
MSDLDEAKDTLDTAIGDIDSAVAQLEALEAKIDGKTLDEIRLEINRVCRDLYNTKDDLECIDLDTPEADARIERDGATETSRRLAGWQKWAWSRVGSLDDSESGDQWQRDLIDAKIAGAAGRP